MSNKTAKKIDVCLLLILIFGGWLGLDKLYKKDVKLFIIKLLLTFVLVGIVWNIYDIVCCILSKYKLNPLA